MISLIWLPFRVIWFLVKALLYPWYIKLFFRLPWWVLAAMAAFLVTLVIEDATKAIGRQLIVNDAIVTAPPTLKPLRVFNSARDANAFGEVQISGFYRADLGAIDWEVAGPDLAYVPIFVDAAETVGAVLLVLKVQANDVVTWLMDQNQSGAGATYADVTLGGVIKQSSHQRDIFAALRVDGFDVLHNAPVIEPFYQGRVRGLEKAVGGNMAFAVILGVLALVLGVLAVFKFVRWWASGQKRAAPLPKPKVITQPTLPLRSTAKTKQSNFAKIPVVSRKKGKTLAETGIEQGLSVMPNASFLSLRRPFRLRTPEEIVDDVFGPNGGRDTPRRRF
ncbi:MAG: hypothetical protein WA790_15320 [Sulfitobacter sp.]